MMVEKEKINIDNSIRELRKMFLGIREMGYVKSVRNGSTGIGATFESLIGKKEDRFDVPDFEGVEIKTRRGYSKSLINLFNAAPMGETTDETRRLRDMYGYPDKKDKSLKRFSGKIDAVLITKIGLFYSFRLRVDRDKKRIILCVYDWNMVCIDESTYWDLDVIKDKLYRKINVLALIKAWTNNIDGVEHFKYYRMNVYVLKSFDDFIKAIEEGYIKVSFKIGNHYEPDKYGDVQAHGVGFAIKEENLDKIFELYR